MILLALGCAAEPLRPVATLHPLGVELEGQAIEHVTLRGPDGQLIESRALPAPIDRLDLRHIWQDAGTFSLVVTQQGQRHELLLPVEALSSAVLLELEAPVGSAPVVLHRGQATPITLIDGNAVQVALVATALAPIEVELQLAGEEHEAQLRAGEKTALLARVDGDAEARVVLDGEIIEVPLPVVTVPAAQARQRLQLGQVRFPAASDGNPSVGLSPGRVTLPSEPWREVLEGLGLSARKRDPWSPWAWFSVPLANTGDVPRDLVLRSRIVDEAGQPSRHFLPRMRDGTAPGGWVSVMVRVPPSQQVTAAVPLFVDERGLMRVDVSERVWRQQLEVVPLGSQEPLHTAEQPLYVSRGSAWSQTGIAGSIGLALGGAGLVGLRTRRWLRDLASSELMTIALFAALVFGVQTASTLLSLGVSALVGPFSPLLLGLFDDVLRFALIATLITLVPRVGTAALTIVVGWLLSGVLLGSFGPSDLLFVGSRVLLFEAALWAFGITRSGRWLDQPVWARWLRLSLAFGGANLCSTAVGIVLHVMLYRLYFADWYVGLLLAGPGVLYVALANLLAVPFADSLRGIQR